MKNRSRSKSVLDGCSCRTTVDISDWVKSPVGGSAPPPSPPGGSATTFKNMTVIGIAKDGHVIYGPYLSSGIQVTSGFDICNGMFYDSIGNYGYFATETYPYITGCFGPGNYPTFTPNCTTNGPKKLHDVALCHCVVERSPKQCFLVAFALLPGILLDNDNILAILGVIKTIRKTCLLISVELW